jgi:hypothetical protein
MIHMQPILFVSFKFSANDRKLFLFTKDIHIFFLFPTRSTHTLRNEWKRQKNYLKIIHAMEHLLSTGESQCDKIPLGSY